MACYTIHFGDFGGTVSKAIWLIMGLALPLLTVTGYLMWWNRLLKKKWERYFKEGDRIRTGAATTAETRS